MKTKSTAIILCFFLGGLGIHKFYLGQGVAGFFYILFCWTFIPSLIAFCEFFILLLMSDREFDSRFNYKFINTQPTHKGGPISAKDATGALSDLKKLYDQGVLTAEEYEERRLKLLDYL
jgi:TM2 domain-containing membrane protein YozV